MARRAGTARYALENSTVNTLAKHAISRKGVLGFNNRDRSSKKHGATTTHAKTRLAEDRVNTTTEHDCKRQRSTKKDTGRFGHC